MINMNEFYRVIYENQLNLQSGNDKEEISDEHHELQNQYVVKSIKDCFNQKKKIANKGG